MPISRGACTCALHPPLSLGLRAISQRPRIRPRPPPYHRVPELRARPQIRLAHPRRICAHLRHSLRGRIDGEGELHAVEDGAARRVLRGGVPRTGFLLGALTEFLGGGVKLVVGRGELFDCAGRWE